MYTVKQTGLKVGLEIIPFCLVCYILSANSSSGKFMEASPFECKFLSLPCSCRGTVKRGVFEQGTVSFFQSNDVEFLAIE